MNSKKKILVVDDQPLCRTVLSITLRQIGFIVNEARNGIEALEAISANSYDLVLMDFNMPEMDGIECTKLIREKETGTEFRLPIIGQSASDETDIETRCLQIGMDAYISKECTTEQFHAAIFKWTADTQNQLRTDSEPLR